MPLLHATNLCLAFGDVALLDHIELAIDRGERIALIGRNGAGKSSLLKVLAGLQPADDGNLGLNRGLSIAYVPQEPSFTDGHSVYDAIAEGLGEAAQALTAYHHALVDITDDEESLTALAALQARLDAVDGWTLNSRIEEAISRLDLPPDTPVTSLSGGMKKRVALGRALVARPDLLLLDEPTNHLDIRGIEWLEETVKGFAGASVVISHDRRFLETFATRIIELDRGLIASFPGTFADYLRRKAELLNAENVQNARFDKLLAEEEVWIRKGVEARRTRNEGRVRRLEELRRIRAARRDQQGNVKLAVDAGDRSGKLVAELKGISKSYGERTLIKGFSAIVQRGDRIGFVGANGVGKTTLIKLILGEIEPDAGSVRLGTGLNIAYFDQFREALDPEATLGDIISPGSEFVEIGGARKHVISYLGDFLFPPQRARAKVKSLSGGERNRLLLARLFAKPANLLVLDEPTNDLDIETLELLEAMLQDYSGTVFLVSHDRTFLDNVVTQVYAFEPDEPGVLREYAGGYSDWVAHRASVTLSAAARAAENASPSKASTAPAAPSRKAKLSFNEQRELDDLPKKIEALEREKAAIEASLADGSLFRRDATEANRLAVRLTEIDTDTLTAMERWEALETKRGA